MTSLATRESPLIQSVEIDDLFGQFHYQLRSPASLRGEDQLLLLYGDNGAGKSTILNILFHLLHPEPYGGHRTAVGKIPFRHVRIFLTSGYTISAEKEDPFDQTKYDLQLIQPDSDIVVQHTWEYDRRRRDTANTTYTEYCRILQRSGPVFHFLSDTRRVAGLSEDSVEGSDEHVFPITVRGERAYVRAAQAATAATTGILVARAVNRTIDGLRRLALTGTNTGYTSVNTIYEKLIGQIVESRSESDSPDVMSNSELRKNLAAIHERTSEYAKYGLTPELDTDQLLGLLDRAKPENIGILNTVLRPYFDGHHARLNALESVQKIIDKFVTMLTEFFSYKTVELDVKIGLRILDPKGNEIPPESLSSGERQLVVLLCNAIDARRDGTILIIDEPEISLNVKWQRQLISALLACVEGVSTQLVLATHSIEILSKYRDFVVPLTAIAEATGE